MTFPYLSGYLSLNVGGQTCELINGCRTKRNFNRPGSAQEWELAPPQQMWPGCCCSVWEDFEDEDPWFDPNNPASMEVAGAFINPPDLNGHGFYIEPSTSTRILEEGGPLEAYATIDIIAGTAAGERYFIDWLTSQLSQSNDNCGDLQLNVATECPCEPCLGVSIDCFPASEILASEVVGPHCGGETPPSQGGNIFTDSGIRQLLRARYKGIEELGETLSLCSGNSYKLNFEILDYEWFTPAGFACELEPNACETQCFDNDLYTICVDEDVPDPCVSASFSSRFSSNTSTLTRLSQFNSSTANGLIGLDGRWSKPEKVNLTSCILDHMPASKDAVPAIRITNDSGQEIKNFRVIIQEEVVGAPPPSTNQGFGLYKNIESAYEKRFYSIKSDGVITVDLLGKAYECCRNMTIEPTGYENFSHEFLGCDKRYWITLETPCNTKGLSAEIFIAYRERI